MDATITQPWPKGAEIETTSANAGSLTKLFQTVARMMEQHPWRVASIPEPYDEGGAKHWRVRLQRKT